MHLDSSDIQSQQSTPAGYLSQVRKFLGIYWKDEMGLLCQESIRSEVKSCGIMKSVLQVINKTVITVIILL